MTRRAEKASKKKTAQEEKLCKEEQAVRLLGEKGVDQTSHNGLYDYDCGRSTSRHG